MTPFSVTCTTCRRSFRVVRPEAIGQILGCPKCGSMVLVEAPAGWSGEGVGAAAATVVASAAEVVQASVPTVPVVPAASSATEIEHTAAEALAMLEAPAKPPPLKVPVSVPKSTVAEPLTPVPPLEVATSVSHWPRWFLPSALGVIALSGLIVAVRLMFSGNDDAPVEDPVDEVAVAPQAAPVLEPPVPVESDLPPAAAVENDKPMAEPALREEAKPVVEQVKAEPQAPQEIAVPMNETAAPATENPPPHRFALNDPGLRPVIDDPRTTTAPAAPVAEPPRENSLAEEAKPAAAATVQRTLQRVPPRQVNIEARLSDPLASLAVRDMPLWKFVDLLSGISGVPISVDTTALRELNQSPLSPVSLRLSNTTVADVLENTLESLGLAYEVRGGGIVVGYGSAEAPRTISYTVDDLTKNDDAALAELVRLVPQLVSPASWQANGGRGSIAAGGGKLVVEQTPAVHRQIINFCERLRVARGLPIKSRHDPARFLLTSREAKAKPVLGRTITANFAAPQPLADVVAWLREASDCVILIDHAALAAAGGSSASECSFVAADESLANVLDKLVAPMELAWRVVDERTVEITTPAAALRNAEVEFLPVGDVARDAAAGQTLIAQLQRTLSEVPWGDLPQQVCVQFDAPSRALLVRAPQRVQAQVEAFLTKARAGK